MTQTSIPGCLARRAGAWKAWAILLLATLPTLAGCSGISVLNAVTPGGSYSLVSGVVYQGGDQFLDVYVPHHARQAPVVVFLYGGSWQKESTYTREQYRFVGEALAARGYLTIIPDYRLYPAVRYPAFIDDCAAAVVWAHTHAAAFGGDPEKLVLLGHSAGGYNAAMLALDPAYLQRAGGERAWIKAMVGLAGAYDFLPLTDKGLRNVFATAVPIDRSQPINRVDGRNPPILLLAGSNDDIVYVKNTNNLQARIAAAHGPVEKYIYPKLGHALIVASLSTRLQGHADVMQRTMNFFERTLKLVPTQAE